MTHRFLLALALGFLLAGCKKDDESLSEKTGRKVGETATKFVKGVGTGIDQSLTVKTELDAELVSRGVSKTIAKSSGPDGQKKGISVYLISKNELTATLMAKALDKGGLEIGRSKTDVVFEKDGAQYVTFYFDDEMDTALVGKYHISLAP